MKSRQLATPHFKSFSSFAISLPIFVILSFRKSKSSRPIRDESHSFVFPPNFIYLSPSIPLQVLTNPDSVSGAPGKAYYSFNLPNSEMHFSILSMPALTVQARFTVISVLTLFFIVSL